MKRSNHILHFESLDLLGIALALFVFSLRMYEVIPILIIFLFKSKNRLCFLLFWLLAAIIFVLYVWVDNMKIPSHIHGEAEIVDIKSFDEWDRITIQMDYFNYVTNVIKDKYHIGDRVIIEANVNSYPNQTIPFGFDAYHYYQSLGIVGKLDVLSIKEVESKHHFYELRELIMNHYEDISVSPYMHLMLFGKKIDEENLESYEVLGLMHLLSLSGIHLYMVAQLLKKMSFHLNLSTHLQTYITLIFYLLMTYLHHADFGVLRLLIMALCIHLNDRFEWRRSKLELIQISFFIVFMLQIRTIYSISFGMLYMIITLLHLLEPLYRKFRGFNKRFVMGLIVIVILIPFQSEINLLTPLILPLMSMLIVSLFMGGSLIVFLIPDINPLFEGMTQLLDQLTLLLSEKSWMIIYGDGHVYRIIFYMIFLCLFLITSSKIKRMLFLCGMVITLFLPLYLRNQESSITFLDVGQGDASVIRSDGCVAVIDAYQGITDYLIDQGIHELDYLVLTHSDTDHIKEANDLIEQLDIKLLITSSADQEYPRYTHRMEQAKAGDSYSCGDLKLNVLSPFGHETTSNNASLVIQTQMGEQTFLFAGDIEIETEYTLVNHYGSMLQSDILKVSHHGSNSSSTELFLRQVEPKIAIISVGRQNHYDFPHDEVIMRLRHMNITIYRTDTHGTIVYQIKQKKVKWQFYLPF